MKIHEHQAKAIFARYGIPVPEGGVASTPQEAREIAQRLGGRVVVKAQVHAGGRGRAGGIKVVDSPEAAQQAAVALLGKHLVTHQTGPEGVPVSKVLVEQVVPVERELYLAIVVDGSGKAPVIIGSEAGGMDIEEVAAIHPEKILQVRVDPIIGFQPYMGRDLAYAMHLPSAVVRNAATIIGNLHRVFIDEDATLAEINPLVLTPDGKLLALDGKLNLDDDAFFRHPTHQQLQDPEQEDPLEVEAGKYDISYVKLDGDVGCMVNGAGLAMATLDVINAAHAQPANFLDIGGGGDEAKVAQAFRLVVADPKVKRVFINVFGGILRCDVAARGIVQAYGELKTPMPIVVRMRGTNAEEGRQILNDSGIPVRLVADLKEAIAQLQQVGRR
ncbi:MAG: ADP-forming succinate--CoA ligase subunit beta [Dehalococcoidia bacterium]|nr:ADP-forming succinate--CoA ligase subunit beta [Dehalococcoidia bacterium]